MKKKYLLILALILIFLLVRLFFRLFICIDEFHVLDNSSDNLKEIFLETKTGAIVILYSCANRYWEKTIENHLKIIDKLTQNDKNEAIIGFHYWKENENDNVKFPLEIKDFNQKGTITEDPFGYSFNNECEKAIIILKKFIYSTKIALENAESVYFNLYKKDMPNDQPILRFRYDTIIDDIEKLPFPIKNKDNYYLSIWNTKHRKYDKNNKEIADALVITTKGALIKILNVEINDFLKENSDEIQRMNCFHESILYFLLTKLNIEIIFDFNIKSSLIRKDDIKETLSI
jgi:hypothetical protein